MIKFIAFLRAINVGGHNVKMDRLKLLFEEMGFQKVETFIASGNVIFESDKTDRQQLETKIEKYLSHCLGYDVAAFIRTIDELKKIVNYKPFPDKKYEIAVSNNIGFIKQPLRKKSDDELKSFESAIDYFHSNKTEIYWLCKTGQSKSDFSANAFERKIKSRITFRGIKTLKKLLDKYSKI